MSSRAVGFVLLGLCIGLFVGLAQVVLKEAWLTVLEGFRPGRQLILSQPETVLGTSEKSTLPFIAFGAKGVEPVHVQIVRQPNGTYVVRDNNSRTGTFVNGQQLRSPALLRNGDVVQLGPNKVLFSERFHQGRSDGPPAAAPPVPQPARVPSPPPVAAVPIPQAVKPAPGPLTGIPVPTGRPVPPAKPAPPPQARPAVPKAPPTPRVLPEASPVPRACPICGTDNPGAPGKRVCENCGMKY